MVKNLPTKAGDVGLIPGPGGFHMPWINKACAAQLLSPHAELLKPTHLEPVVRNKRSYHSDKPACCGWRVVPSSSQLEEASVQQQRPRMTKKQIIKNYYF